MGVRRFLIFLHTMSICLTSHTLLLRFAQSDALWAGLVRGVYAKVEQRIAYGKQDTRKADGHGFKRKWRVECAKKKLVERFGQSYMRRVAAYTVVLMLALLVLIVLEVTGYAHAFTAIYSSIVSSIDAAIGVVAGLLATVAAIVPSFRLAFASNQESSVSRGEVIFNKASTVKDQLGFLESVKRDLQELFDYLREFEKLVGARIIIVPIVDDLDRCITDGRNVKVLEAMQLILSVPGAPIISFLAVDSRIVVASIEEHYAKVFAETNISGYEFLDKIVQIPFALPEPPLDKLKRMMSKTLEGDAASPAQVAHRLSVFSTRVSQILKQAESKRVTFKVASTRENPDGAEVKLAPLVLAIEGKRAGKSPLEMDSEQALKLVCAAAAQLGPHLKALAARPGLAGQSIDTIYCMNKEESVELLCREINGALETGSLGFAEKVRVINTIYSVECHLALNCIKYAQCSHYNPYGVHNTPACTKTVENADYTP